MLRAIALRRVLFNGFLVVLSASLVSNITAYFFLQEPVHLDPSLDLPLKVYLPLSLAGDDGATVARSVAGAPGPLDESDPR